MHMRQHGVSWRQSPDPFKRLAKRQVTWVRPVLQRVDDQHVEVAQPLRGGLRKAADVGAIGERADAKTERYDVAMDLRQRLEGEGTPSPSMTTGLAWSMRCGLTIGG